MPRRDRPRAALCGQTDAAGINGTTTRCCPVQGAPGGVPVEVLLDLRRRLAEILCYAEVQIRRGQARRIRGRFGKLGRHP